MKKFEDEEIRGLITTDIMARGLDISDITDVINFEVPEIPEQYIHRIGRTGRADKNGRALTFITQKEELPLLSIELLMDKELTLLPFPEDFVAINPKKIASEKEEVKMKNPVKLKINEGGGAFHEKKAKNKKINLGGPSKRKPPKKYGANRAQQKAKSISKRKK